MRKQPLKIFIITEIYRFHLHLNVYFGYFLSTSLKRKQNSPKSHIFSQQSLMKALAGHHLTRCTCRAPVTPVEVQVAHLRPFSSSVLASDDSDPETVWLIISHYQPRWFSLPSFRFGGKVAQIPATRIRESALTSDLHLMCVARDALTPSRGPINTSLLKQKLFWRDETMAKRRSTMGLIVSAGGRGSQLTFSGIWMCLHPSKWCFQRGASAENWDNERALTRTSLAELYAPHRQTLIKSSMAIPIRSRAEASAAWGM